MCARLRILGIFLAVILLAIATSIVYWGPLIVDNRPSEAPEDVLEGSGDTLAIFGSTQCIESDRAYIEAMIGRFYLFATLDDIAGITGRAWLSPVLTEMAVIRAEMYSVRTPDTCAAVFHAVVDYMDATLASFEAFMMEEDLSIRLDLRDKEDKAQEFAISTINDALNAYDFGGWLQTFE